MNMLFAAANVARFKWANKRADWKRFGFPVSLFLCLLKRIAAVYPFVVVNALAVLGFANHPKGISFYWFRSKRAMMESCNAYHG
ncbi:hypothetical protein [Parageobacillus thermoglucosidasius]|uniref:Uncharacterized protein n=1 Tax=Parageobacillus thermoglucosidasius TaxID=1426 RepID=A0AAN1D727_PARTM|nr:hypothetical protein [Parageobacillus thermoglucosidasius]REK54194.1 MAG: hypothetical protein C6P36_14980 [Geobacillus sp.]ALF10716.1 hypothetical protein AOT13_12195 [Parageobacillus thermoglucosidasius]ANZ30794.1 hypothetical protein BCV53_12205 [Parageobacillus thermoglucosidasius]APM81531.1 hypothetical protein BCV54_12215 [Parageobacillus thermoglucosidasius]KJX69365.1 hypothetical protein WH82_07770 [Parageobacillus thermoglucosidasius]